MGHVKNDDLDNDLHCSMLLKCLVCGVNRLIVMRWEDGGGAKRRSNVREMTRRNDQQHMRSTPQSKSRTSDDSDDSDAVQSWSEQGTEAMMSRRSVIDIQKAEW